MSQKTSTTEYIWLSLLAVFIIATVVMVALLAAPKIKELLPNARPTRTPVPGISSVGEGAPLQDKIAVQPFIADEIERISDGGMDVLHVEVQGDFAVTIVIWVKEGTTEAQGSEIDELLAGQYPIVRLVNVMRVPQLDYMVFVVNYAYDCVATGIPEYPLQCAHDVETLPGHMVPDEGLDLLNE